MIFSLKLGLRNGLPVKIGESDQFLGIGLFGKPGEGKSALLANMWQTHSLSKTGKILIDPSGSLARDAYAMSGGYYCSLEHPVGLNPMLDGATPNDTADNLIEVVNQVVELSTDNVKLTTRMRSILTEAVVWCCEHDQRTLDAVVDHIKNRSQGHHETRQGLIDRLNMFIQDPRLRAILCEADPISWKDIADNGKTFVLDCHAMSHDKMLFIGNIVTHGIKSYFRSSKGPFNPLVLIVDEFQNFISTNFSDIFREARKYKISTIISTQSFAEIPHELVSLILSTVGTLVSFRVGFKEASLLSREFPNLQPQDFQFLEKYHCAYRTPKNEGICKTMPPPFVKPREIQAPEVIGITEFDWFDIVGPCPE